LCAALDHRIGEAQLRELLLEDAAKARFSWLMLGREPRSEKATPRRRRRRSTRLHAAASNRSDLGSLGSGLLGHDEPGDPTTGLASTPRSTPTDLVHRCLWSCSGGLGHLSCAALRAQRTASRPRTEGKSTAWSTPRLPRGLNQARILEVRLGRPPSIAMCSGRTLCQIS
jgi:hypothetical protein